MKPTLFRNQGAPHAIPNSLVPGSICFDRFPLLSRILFEQPLSNGSLPNMNPPSFCFPLAVRMTKVCYLGDYRQFLSARAAKQIEEPILPWWVESLATISFPEFGCFPNTHQACLCVCGPWETTSQHTADWPAKSCTAHFPAAPTEMTSKSTGKRQKVNCWSIQMSDGWNSPHLCSCRTNNYFKFFLFLLLMCECALFP